MNVNLEFEKQQLKQQVDKVDDLFHRIAQMQGSERDVGDIIKRQAELEL